MADSRKTPMPIAHIAKALVFFTNQEQKEREKGFSNFSSAEKLLSPLCRHSKNRSKEAAGCAGSPEWPRERAAGRLLPFLLLTAEQEFLIKIPGAPWYKQ